MEWEEYCRCQKEIDQLDPQERDERIRAYVRAGWQVAFLENRTREFDIYSPDGSVYEDHALMHNECPYCYSDNDICYHDEQLMKQANEAQRLYLLLRTFPFLDEQGGFAPSLEDCIREIVAPKKK